MLQKYVRCALIVHYLLIVVTDYNSKVNERHLSAEKKETGSGARFFEAPAVGERQERH